MIRSFSGWRMLAGVAASALLLTLYARGGAAFLLGFIALVPWMLGLQACQGWRGTLLGAWAMTIAFVLAVFGWFAFAIAGYLGLSPVLALLVIALAAPLLQPQFIACAAGTRLLPARHMARCAP